MYFPVLSSSFKEDEYKQVLIKKLKNVQEDVNNLVHWHKQCVDECNCNTSENKEEYNSDYLELQRIVNKLLD